MNVLGWCNATIRIDRWMFGFWTWRFEGYRPDEAEPVKALGVTYTYWGARRRLKKVLMKGMPS